MSRIQLRTLALLLASAIPIGFGATLVQAAEPAGKGKGKAHAEAPGNASAAAVGAGKSEIGASAAGPDSDGAGDGAVSAEASAAADLSTDEGLEAQAASEAAAGVTEEDDVTSISAETSADTSVTDATSDDVSTKTISFDKQINTRFGERSMSRSMTFSTLEDGTKVKSTSHATAMALGTPGVTKADTRSRADVQLQDDIGSEDAGLSGEDPDAAGETMDPAGISEANLDN